MARVDYFGIEEAIKTVLEANAALAGVQVGIEEELPFTAAVDPQVEIYLERRDAPELQPLAGGQRTRFLVRFSIWCYGVSLDSIAKACEVRDDLIGAVELALMADRTLGGTVNASWLEGGAFDTKETPGASSGFGMGGEIILMADVKATTT